MVTYLGSPVQSCCGEGGTLQISLVCVGSAPSAWATLSVPFLMACVLSQSTLLRLQVTLQGNCLKWALGCVHFSGLSCSGLGSRALRKGIHLVGLVLCALPRSEQLRRPGVWRAHSPQVERGILSPPPSHQLGFLGAQHECWLRCALCLLWGADLWLRPSW